MGDSKMITKTGLIGQQQGAALVVALIMLVLMTLVSITAMQVTTVQQKMVTNSRDLNTAFQAAETALRRGEDYILLMKRGKATELDDLFTDPCTSGLCKPKPESSDPQWLPPNVSWADDSTTTLKYGSEPAPAGASTDIPDISPLPDGSVAKQPRFMIEDITPSGAGTPKGGLGTTKNDNEIGKGWFRITAQGYGQAQGEDGKSLSRVMLQSVRKKD